MLRHKYPKRRGKRNILAFMLWLITLTCRMIRLEADVKHSLAEPKMVDEALAELESKVGKDGRRKFEKFLREVGELDDEDDVIDVGRNNPG